MRGAIHHSPNTPPWRGAQLKNTAITVLLLDQCIPVLSTKYNSASLIELYVNVVHVQILLTVDRAIQSVFLAFS